MISDITKQSYGYSAKATISLLGKPQEITLFFDEELGIVQSNSVIVDKVTNFLAKELNFEAFLTEVSQQVANICFAQSSQKPNAQEIAEFAKDISVLKLNVFDEDMVFYFLAVNFLPDLVITCQINFANEIENLELVEQRFIAFDRMLDRP